LAGRRFIHLHTTVAALAFLFAGLSLVGGPGPTASADFVPSTTSNWLAIDCDLTTPGVQNDCAAFVGHPLDVGIVFGNVTGVGSPGPQQLAALNFHLANSQASLLAPQAPTCAGAALDCSPDFNDLELTGGWDCSPVPPAPDDDSDADPATTRSRLVCFNALLDTPVLAQNSNVLLATVSFDALAQGTADLSLEEVAVANHQVLLMASCSPDIDATNAVCATASVTVLDPGADADLDAVDNIDDNCPFDMNPAQTNTDSGPPPPAGNVGAIGNGVFMPGDDVTVPGGDSRGDACDLDSDNDGLPDTIDPEPGLPRDLTVDDNGDGNPAVGCFGGTDPDDDGVSWDMDCDGKLDGAPADCGSVTLDADGDGLRDAWETCRWGTSNSSVDSDGDGIGDCTEAFDINGNSLVNSADATFVAQAVFGVNPRDWAFDMNGNGNITNADAVFIWQAVFNVITCL
jgi:hypothetical protein